MTYILVYAGIEEVFILYIEGAWSTKSIKDRSEWPIHSVTHLSDRRLLCNMHNSNRHRSTKVQIICSLWLTWRDYILLGFGIKGRCLLFLLFGICFGFLSFVLCTVWFICLYSASCCCAFSSFLIWGWCGCCLRSAFSDLVPFLASPLTFTSFLATVVLTWQSSLLFCCVAALPSFFVSILHTPIW